MALRPGTCSGCAQAPGELTACRPSKRAWSTSTTRSSPPRFRSASGARALGALTTTVARQVLRLSIEREVGAQHGGHSSAPRACGRDLTGAGERSSARRRADHQPHDRFRRHGPVPGQGRASGLGIVWSALRREHPRDARRQGLLDLADAASLSCESALLGRTRGQLLRVRQIEQPLRRASRGVLGAVADQDDAKARGADLGQEGTVSAKTVVWLMISSTSRATRRLTSAGSGPTRPRGCARMPGHAERAHVRSMESRSHLARHSVVTPGGGELPLALRKRGARIVS